jgi:MoxR-like ATPase
MNDWFLFQGSRESHDGIQSLPDPPPWRSFSKVLSGKGEEKRRTRGETYQASQKEMELVNAALYLRRPLLVTGKPGTGKTSLAYAVAYELRLGQVLYWPITTRTTLNDGLYEYDAIGRAQEMGPTDERNLRDIERYIRLGPLGTAFLKSKPKRPCVLLIDEIDKSDIDLPNDLLHIFEEGRFEIKELTRIAEQVPKVTVQTAFKPEEGLDAYDLVAEIEGGSVSCNEFPFVIMTSNGERDFPPPFLRRCLRLKMEEPNEEELNKIVMAHFNDKPDILTEAQPLITKFLEERKAESQGDLATDQLLNAIYLKVKGRVPIEIGGSASEIDDRHQLINYLFRHLSSSEDA